MKSILNKNKALIKTFLSELDQNLTAIDSFLATDSRVHLPGSPLPEDRNGFTRFVQMLYAAFPDLTHEIQLIVAEGNAVSSLIVAHGTHKGNFQGIAPTGKKVTINDIIITRVEQDKIIELWAQFDALGLLAQLKE